MTSPHNREAFIGYCLSRDSWGQGYATETAKGLLSFGFSQLRLHRIFATCDPANLASARVLEKSGMQLEGDVYKRQEYSLILASVRWGSNNPSRSITLKVCGLTPSKRAATLIVYTGSSGPCSLNFGHLGYFGLQWIL